MQDTIMTKHDVIHALDNAFENAFLVYYFRGKMIVKQGNVKRNRLFEPYDNPRRYHTGLHDFPMRLSYGKVWCRSAEEVPKAIEMVKQARQKYISGVEKRYEELKKVGEIE